MKRGTLVAAALSAALALTGCIDGGSFGNAYHETETVTKALSSTGSFSLENTNGNVHVATWDEPSVRIEAVKAAPTEQALQRMEVVVEGEGERVAVRTRYPQGHFFGSRGKVDYTITLPRQARVSIEDVNGRVEVEGVAGRVRAKTVNGTVNAFGISGEVEASTVNGTINVMLARVDPGSRNRLSATNGTVRVTLPRDAAADVEASTVNGAVSCDFELDGGRRSRRHVEGRVGGGGARFELQTVNGTASIDRGLASKAEATPAPSATPRIRAEAEPAAAR